MPSQNFELIDKYIVVHAKRKHPGEKPEFIPAPNFLLNHPK